MKVTKISDLSGKIHSMEMPDISEAQYREFNSPASERRNIQDIFPQLDADQREFLKTGITPDEWDATFA